MVVPHGFQNHRRIFNKIRHATRPGTDCHEEERPRKAIRRVVIEAFTDRQIVHVFQCSTNEMPVQRPHHRNARTDGRRWTMRPRGPPGTSAPTNAAQPWCAGPRAPCGAQGRIHGRGGRPRPPAPRTHKDDAGGRCVHAGRRGRRPLPTPHSLGVQGRAYHVARRAVYMVGADVLGRPPPARTGTMPVDDTSARAAEDVGPYQRRTYGRAAHIM